VTLILNLMLILIPTTVMHANEEMDEDTTKIFEYSIKRFRLLFLMLTFNRYDFLRLVHKE